GDIPIYIARDSVEMWTQSEIFLVDERKNPTVVSGVPPDDFSDDGQHWGNPIYDWTYMKQNDYKWWDSRMRESYKLYDVVRIDHFRGCESYWEIPSHSKTGATGQWKKGPGIDLFKEIKNQLGDIRVIAEDLDRKSTRLNSSHVSISYAGFSLKKKTVRAVQRSEADESP